MAMHVIAMLAQAQEMSNAAHTLLVCSFIRLRPKGSIRLQLYPDKHRLRRKSWGNSALKGSLGRGVPPRPSNADPVYDKKLFISLSYLREGTLLKTLIRFVLHTEL